MTHTEETGDMRLIDSMLCGSPTFGETLSAIIRPLHPEAESTPKQRILIVDDEEYVTFTLREGLRKLPHCEVFVTLSGQQALSLFEEQPFDLLITDYKMPGLNGVALAGYIQQRYPGTGIIMITAHGHELMRDADAKPVIQRILHKPVRLTEVRDVAVEILALHGNQKYASADHY